MSRFRKWRHKRGKHYFTKPLHLIEAQENRIESKNGDAYKYEEVVYQRTRCEYCNKRTNIEIARLTYSHSRRGVL